MTTEEISEEITISEETTVQVEVMTDLEEVIENYLGVMLCI